jgi:amino acid transporter
MVDFRDVIDTLKETGVLDVILPFLLFYSITFAILEKSKVFHPKESQGEDGKFFKGKPMNYVSMIVAFVVGFFGIMFYNLIETVQELIAYSVVFMVFFLCILLILGMLFGDSYMELFKKSDGNWNYKVIGPIAIVVTLIIVFTLLYIIGAMDPFIKWWDRSDFDATNETIVTLVFFIIIGVVMYMVSKEKGDKSSSGGHSGHTEEKTE